MARKQKRRDQRRGRAQWQELIEQWRGSGQSVGAFCAERGLQAPTLTWWRWRLGAGDRAKSLSEVATRQEPGRWLRVEMQGRPGPAEERAGFELCWPDGRSLRVPQEFDAGALERLLSVLGGRPC